MHPPHLLLLLIFPIDTFCISIDAAFCFVSRPMNAIKGAARVKTMRHGITVDAAAATFQLAKLLMEHPRGAPTRGRELNLRRATFNGSINFAHPGAAFHAPNFYFKNQNWTEFMSVCAINHYVIGRRAKWRNYN
jgi:hypothetical protein